MVRRAFLTAFVGILLAVPTGPASAEDISGLIATTRVIRENSRLVGNVTCMVTGAPCISFGAPRITLRLEGFTMTGLADPNTGCAGGLGAGEMGINSSNQADVEVRGPGVVQRFRADGVFFTGSLGGKIEGVTVTTNCQSGIRVAATSSQIEILSNITVRNGNTGVGLACGGI
jgi:Right handed beta helix region